MTRGNPLVPCAAAAVPGRDYRRRRVVDAARTLFVGQGFHRTGVAQIETASGVRVQQIYRDFGSKEGVIAAIVQEDLETYLDEGELNRAAGAGDRDALRRWIRRCGGFEGTIEDCRMMTEIFAEAGRNPRIGEINRSTNARVRRALRLAIGALAPDAETGRRDGVADLLMALSIGLMAGRAVDDQLRTDAVRIQLAAIVDRELNALAD